MDDLKVSLENILPLTYARDHFSQIVNEVQSDRLFILTKGGKPAVAIVDVRYLEAITGGRVQRKDIDAEIQKAPEKVGLPPMVEHPAEEAESQNQPVKRDIFAEYKPEKKEPPKPAGFAAPQPPTGAPLEPTPKPAGFAAPMPPQSKPPEPAKTFIPRPEEKPLPPPPPPIGSPSEPVTPPPSVTGPLDKEYDDLLGDNQNKPTSNEENLTPIGGPKMDQNQTQNPPQSGIPDQPLTTLPPVKSEDSQPAEQGGSDQVDVEFAPDVDQSGTSATHSDNSQPDSATSHANPDDSNPPAQYAGEEEEKEPGDMVID